MTDEAIRAHPQAFISGIAGTIWAQLWARRVFAPGARRRATTRTGEAESPDFVVVNGRRLPTPGEGQLIPASHVGPVIWTLGGQAREVWRSATEHPLVFDDPRDEQRYAEFGRDTERLADRIPTRDANQGLVHRLNQASNRFPPPVFWIAVGLIALAVRRPGDPSSLSRWLLPGSSSSWRRLSWPWTCPSTPCPSRPPSCCLRQSGSSVPTRAGRYACPGVAP